MTDIEAIRIVLELAEQNVAPEDDMPEEYERQMKALAVVMKLLKFER